MSRSTLLCAVRGLILIRFKYKNIRMCMRECEAPGATADLPLRSWRCAAFPIPVQSIVATLSSQTATVHPPRRLGRQSTVLMRNERTNEPIHLIYSYRGVHADATVTREESCNRFLLARQIIPDGVSSCRSILPSICRKNSTVLFDLLLAALHVTTPLEMLGGGFPRWDCTNES
jgi:hypothetical protein